MNANLIVKHTTDRHNKPLAIVHNFPGGDAEMYPADMRLMAAALQAAADHCDDGSHAGQNVSYPLADFDEPPVVVDNRGNLLYEVKVTNVGSAAYTIHGNLSHASALDLLQHFGVLTRWTHIPPLTWGQELLSNCRNFVLTVDRIAAPHGLPVPKSCTSQQPPLSGDAHGDSNETE
ncbi:hypothetical protein [uncultured Desulfuromonas sp.]|uniref:hypothetical protein n=1 Tax=uncultured Desulfuromonas sp. TaxID=181013 RepID=UPI002AABDCCF|nr:hypothetical protein [uncultured Desulfuromonas sp.]